jgi:hypothetical protein
MWAKLSTLGRSPSARFTTITSTSVSSAATLMNEELHTAKSTVYCLLLIRQIFYKR